MSAVVEDKTINRILAGIRDLKPVEVEGRSLSIPLQALGQRMRFMNEMAVLERYGDERLIPDKPYRYIPMEFPGEIQLLKSLRCFLYQCSEGNVPGWPLYRALDQYSDQIVRAIARTLGVLPAKVYELPEYENAEWG